MQEIPAVASAKTDPFDQLRAVALVDLSSQTRAFASFMGLLARPPQDKAAGQKAEPFLSPDAPLRLEALPRPDAAPVQEPVVLRLAAEAPLATAQAIPAAQAVAAAPAAPAIPAAQAALAAQAAQTAQANGPAAAQTLRDARPASTAARLSSARNTPVTREAFEELRPALTRFGLSDAEVEDLRARTQAGNLTWGQLVHTLAQRSSAAKKPVELSASQRGDLQSFFQKLGFAPDQAKGMVADVAKGEGLRVAAAVQQKLAAMPEDQTLNLNSKEVATFFKALRMPEAAANKLAQFIGPDTTAAGLKGALALAGQELLHQRAQGEVQDGDLARTLGKVMQKDVDKTRRDSGQATGKDAVQQSKDPGAPHITYEMKTPDRNDAKWFDRHDQSKRGGSEDATWREFLSKVRQAEDPAAQARTGGQAARDPLEALLGKAGLQSATAQSRAGSAQQAKPWEKVAAPRVLDQVQEALLKDLGQGRKQMTLLLDPENLGRLQVMLQIKDKDVHATLRAEDPETAKMLSGQLEAIRKTLEDQGLKVQHLEVQTGLASRQDQQLFSANQHNQAQERQELSNLFSRLRLLRADASEVAQEMHNAGVQAILSDTGLHLIA